MAIIFHQITGQHGGALPLDVGTDEPVGAIASQGLLVNAAGVVFATLETPPANWCAGLPFDAHGRLVVEEAAVATYSGGLGFTASGALAVSDTAGTPVYNQGVLMNGGAVRVNGYPLPPTAPVNLAVTTAGIEELLLSWDALVFVPPVTNYTVYWRIVGAPTWNTAANGTSTSRLITGLTSGATYELTVAATNLAGTGPQAAPVTGTPINRASNIALYALADTKLYNAYRMDTTPWTPIELVPGLSGVNMQAVAYSPAAQLLAFGSTTAPYLQVYDASKFPLVPIAGIAQPGDTVNWLEFSPDGNYLGVATANTFASLVYDTNTWTSRALGTGADNSITLNAANTRAVVGAANTAPSGNVQLWDISGAVPALMAPLPSLTGGNAVAVSFHPTQNVVAVASSVPSQAVRVYDVTALSYLGDAPPVTGTASTVKFSALGGMIVIGRTATGTRILDCSALATPASWGDLAFAPIPAGAGTLKMQIFSHTDAYLLSRGVGGAQQAVAIGTPPMANVADFWRGQGALTQGTFMNMPPPPALPGQVQNLVVTPGVTQLGLTWDLLTAANPVTGYIVEWGPVGTVTQNAVYLGVTNSYTITGLTTGTPYEVRVCAQNTGGWGAFTPTQTGTPT